jgi:hypothetical protein
MVEAHGLADEAKRMAIKALEKEPCEDWYDVPSDEMTLEQARQAVKDLRKKLMEYLEQEPTTKNDLGVREFAEIVVEYPPEDLCTYPEYKGKPYFSIKYEEGNDCIIGYGTYNPQVLSRYLKDYFMPTTKNNLAQERYQDLIEYFGDEKVAKTILESRKEFKAWLERLRWNVKRADELARELEQIKSTTKNDLGVASGLENVSPIIDWNNCHTPEQLDSIATTKNDVVALDFSDDIDTPNKYQTADGKWHEGKILTTKNDLAVDKTFYEQIVEYCNEHFLVLVEKDVWEDARKALTPKNDLGVDAVSRKEVMEQCQEWRNLEFVKMTNPYYYLEKRLNNLSSVTIRPKGHWISHEEHCRNLGVTPSGLGAYEWCSNCDCGIDVREWYMNHYNYCPNCGADMREVEDANID